MCVRVSMFVCNCGHVSLVYKLYQSLVILLLAEEVITFTLVENIMQLCKRETAHVRYSLISHILLLLLQ